MWMEREFLLFMANISLSNWLIYYSKDSFYVDDEVKYEFFVVFFFFFI